MAEARTDVDVVVIARDDEEALEGCLEAIGETIGPTLHAYVVDEGAGLAASPTALYGRCPTTLLRAGRGRGWREALHEGVGIGSSPAVCVLETDIRVRPQTIGTLLRALRADPKAALAVPTFSEASVAAGSPAAEPVGLVGRACQLSWRCRLDEVGGWVPNGHREDGHGRDVSVRLRERGWRLLKVRSALFDLAPAPLRPGGWQPAVAS